MKLSYDPRYNIAYIKFKEKPENVESIKLSDEIVIDNGSDGTVYGIELLNANEQLQEHDNGDFVIVNEQTGKEYTVSMFHEKG